MVTKRIPKKRPREVFGPGRIPSLSTKALTRLLEKKAAEQQEEKAKKDGTN